MINNNQIIMYEGRPYRVDQIIHRFRKNWTVIGNPNDYQPIPTNITDLKETNTKIRDILGIDKNQFAQIVMIAQGEFQKFLNASTKDRGEIFRKIFYTSLY